VSIAGSRPGAAVEAASLRLPDGFEWRRREALSWIEASLPGAIAAFSTRAGGLSGGPYASLNLGFLTDDDPTLVAANRDLLARAIGREPEGIALGYQVHGSDLQVHTSRPSASPYSSRGTQPAKADAQLTNRADVTPLVLVADCVPLMLSAPGAVAAVHCGWRGVAAGIVERAVLALAELGGVEAGVVAGVLGPGIGPCCYEVGDEVRSAFRARGHHAVTGATLDLAGAIRAELERAGVDTAAIRACGLCTSCNPALFFSHRRDNGVSGRQAGLVWSTSRDNEGPPANHGAPGIRA
jgi:YfiH family protein